MEAQIVYMRIGDIDLSNIFAGEIGREASLPELVLALDFSFGLVCEMHPRRTMQNGTSP